MTGPEHRWRQRLDARARRRAERRAKPKLTAEDFFIMNAQRQQGEAFQQAARISTLSGQSMGPSIGVGLLGAGWF